MGFVDNRIQLYLELLGFSDKWIERRMKAYWKWYRLPKRLQAFWWLLCNGFLI